MACASHRGPTACKLAALPIVIITQDGDDGINVAFHVDPFETVASVLASREEKDK